MMDNLGMVKWKFYRAGKREEVRGEDLKTQIARVADATSRINIKEMMLFNNTHRQGSDVLEDKGHVLS